MPNLSRVVTLAIAQSPSHRTYWTQIESTARALKITSQRQDIAGPEDIDDAFVKIGKQQPQGLIVLPHAVTIERRRQIVSLAAKKRLPAIYPFGLFAADGGLMSYGANLPDLHRRAAVYVDKILKGAKAGALPVEQPTKFELVVNLATAKQIGVIIPPVVLARADRVIR